MAEICDRPAVILTGFGPFKDHKTNDSWAAVCQITQVRFHSVFFLIEWIAFIFDYSSDRAIKLCGVGRAAIICMTIHPKNIRHIYLFPRINDSQGDRGKSIEESLGVRLVTEHMPVSYDFADRAIPDLWEAHKPLV